MKNIIITSIISIFLGLSTLETKAQNESYAYLQTYPATAQHIHMTTDLDQVNLGLDKIPSWKKKRRAGGILLGVSAASFIGGMSLMATNFYVFYPSNEGAFAVGAAMVLIVTPVTLISGTVLMIKGKKEKKLQLNLNTQQGVALNFTF